MKYIYSFCRLILGLFFFILGINGFLGFLPDFNTSLAFQDFIKALDHTGYFLPFFYGIEIVVASLLLLNLGVLFSSLVLGVILVNFLLMYYFLVSHDLKSPEMMILYFLVLVDLILMTSRGRNYLVLFK